MNEITPNGARLMIRELNNLATRLSDLISEANRRQPRPNPPARFSDEQRGSYEIALRELGYVRDKDARGDNLRAREAHERALDELTAGVAAWTPQEAQAGE